MEQGLEIGVADAFNRVLDFLQTYNANVARGIDLKDMELTEEQIAIAQVLESIAGEGSPSADLIRELEVLQADYVVAMQRRAAAQAAAKATTKAARQAAAAAATTSGSALSAEALLRAVAESRDAAQQAAAAALATKETVDRAIEEHLKGINADIEDLKKKEQEEPGWLQQAAEYLDGLKARFIDSEEPYVPFPTRSQSEPAATPTAPPFRSTGAALDADSVRELRERLVAARCATTTTICSTRCFRGPTRRRCGCVPIAVHRARLAHARPALAKWHHSALPRRLPRARRARRRRRRRRRRAPRGSHATVKRERERGSAGARESESVRGLTRVRQTRCPLGCHAPF